MDRGVGGSNLGQTQVELSGLNHVFHELGPQGEWLSTYTAIAELVRSFPLPRGGVYKPVSFALPGVHPPKQKRDGDMGLELCSPRPRCGDPSQGKRRGIYKIMGL